MNTPPGLIPPVRVERVPDAPEKFRLYGEEGSLDSTGKTYDDRESATTARDEINRSI